MCVIDYGPNKMALNFFLVQTHLRVLGTFPVFKPSRMKVRINREKPNPIMAPSNVTCLQKWRWKTRRENGASSRWFCLMICLVATGSGQCEFATCLHVFKRDKSGYSKGTNIITSRFHIYEWFIVESWCKILDKRKTLGIRYLMGILQDNVDQNFSRIDW